MQKDSRRKWIAFLIISTVGVALIAFGMLAASDFALACGSILVLACTVIFFGDDITRFSINLFKGKVDIEREKPVAERVIYEELVKKSPQGTEERAERQRLVEPFVRKIHEADSSEEMIQATLGASAAVLEITTHDSASGVDNVKVEILEDKNDADT